MPLLYLFLAVLVSVTAWNGWRDGDNGALLWSNDCDWPGADLATVSSDSSQCGSKCLANSQCTHFTWSSWNGGSCFLKQGPVQDTGAIDKTGLICGFVPSRSTGSSGNSCNVQSVVAGIRSGATKIIGTNLGSWFVLEGWMVQQLWQDNNCDQGQVLGQWQFEQCVKSRGRNVASVLENHWNTFITEEDFKIFAEKGINSVRIPVGWWQIYDPQGGANNAKLNYYITPAEYTVGSLKYLDKAFEWGKKYGVSILVDMHAAPGSQNGNDNSSPSDTGKIFWDKYASNTGQTVDSMRLFAERYANNPALLGFELLNEPIVNVGVLQQYYIDAYNAIRKPCPNCMIVISPHLWDQMTPSWANFMVPSTGYTGVWYDVHYYSCFGGPADKPDMNNMYGYLTVDRRNEMKAFNQRDRKGLIVGEWSACSKMSDQNTKTGDFVSTQAKVMNDESRGWYFWSWTNGAPGNVWSFKTALNSGWISSNLLAKSCVPVGLQSATTQSSVNETSPTVTVTSDVSPSSTNSIQAGVPGWGVALITLASVCVMLLTVLVVVLLRR